MEKLSFKVMEYDAPLDLILHLIARHKLSIVDIDISSLLEQYLLIIQQWQARDMDVSSEFLEMASRLVYMKTVSLLPRHEEESEKLKADLTGQLVEYGICKLAARRLGDWNITADVFVREQAEVELDPTYTLIHNAGVLYAALMDAEGKESRRRPPPRESFDAIVAKPFVSVTSKIFTLLRRLRKNGTVSLDGLFDPSAGRSGMVATFLAVLELAKSGKIMIEKDAVRLTGRKAG
jgi:segregation and condensation protein A